MAFTISSYFFCTQGAISLLDYSDAKCSQNYLSQQAYINVKPIVSDTKMRISDRRIWFKGEANICFLKSMSYSNIANHSFIYLEGLGYNI